MSSPPRREIVTDIASSSRNGPFTLKRTNQSDSLLASPSKQLVVSPNKRLKPQTPKSFDRFIPNRQIIDFETCHSELSKHHLHQINENANSKPSHGTSSPAVRKPVDVLTPKLKRMVDVFHTSRAGEQSPLPLGGLEKSASLSRINTSQLNSAKKRQITRVLPSKPSRVLDAPDLLDDYYLNLLHWGPNNVVAIALQKSVYLWNAESSSVDHLCELDGDDNVVTSVQWSGLRNDILAIGTSDSCIQLWDVSTSTQLRNIRSHSSRVSSLSWNNGPLHGGNLLSSGSRDSLILHHDMRSPRAMNQYVGHEQEVCGLAWSPDGKQLVSEHTHCGNLFMSITLSEFTHLLLFGRCFGMIYINLL